MSLAEQLKSVRLKSTGQPKMKSNEPLLCPDSETYQKMMEETQFERYYHIIERWTFPSTIISLDNEQIQGLREGHSVFQHSSSKTDDEKTNESLRLFPSLLKIVQAIDECFIPRPLFVRLSTRSPKDAVLLLERDKFRKLFRQTLDVQPNEGSTVLAERNRRLIALDHISIQLLAVNDGFHAVQLLLASERIQDDLKTISSLNLIVRHYLNDPQRCRSEFRAFIYRRQFTALTQYNEYIFDRDVLKNKEHILRSIRRFFTEENVLEQLPLENCVLDLILVEKDDQYYQVFICEINPLAEFAGTGLFSWLEDRDILLGRQTFEFRIHEKEVENIGEANSQWLALINDAQ